MYDNNICPSDRGWIFYDRLTRCERINTINLSHFAHRTLLCCQCVVRLTAQPIISNGEKALREPMIAQQLSELSEGQKSCLRLVARGMSSKEIARATGLSHYTVDTYIKRALPVIGASNRRDAARIVINSEQSQKIGPPSESVVFQSDSAILNSGFSHRSSDIALSGMFGLPKIGGEVNDLAWVERHYAIIKVAAFGFSVILAIILATVGILWVFE